MKEYLLLFWNAPRNDGYDLDPEKMQEGMKQWQSWIGNIAMQGKLVATKPVEFDGVVVSNDGRSNGPAIPGGIMVTGYLICKSDSPDEVERWSETCPILNSPKGSVEIRACSPFEI